MTISETRATVRQARSIGFSRREVLKLGLVEAGAVVAAACGSDEDATSAVVEDFAVGTWKVHFQLMRNSSASTSPDDPVDMTVNIEKGGSFTTEGGTSDLPTSGTWTFGKAFVQITGTGGVNAMASNVPKTMGDATISWQFDSDGASASNISPSVTWDSGRKTLTIMGTDANGTQFPITATKQ